MVDEQKFRSDLYYRLNVFPIRVPPLRERPDDIPLLVWHFVKQFSERNNRMIDTILPETMETLTRHHWPGNIRELQNVVERSVIITKGATLRVARDELKPDDRLKTNQSCEALHQVLAETERGHILRALEDSRWVVAGPNGAATRLGMKRSTLLSRMQKLGIRLLRAPVPDGQRSASLPPGRDGRVLEWPINNSRHFDGEREIWNATSA
jgi:formate hydrogenlyase transcriptional activator